MNMDKSVVDGTFGGITLWTAVPARCLDTGVPLCPL